MRDVTVTSGTSRGAPPAPAAARAPGAHPTGADLVARLREMAAERGLSLAEFVRPLTPEPQNYLSQLADAQRPLARTIARIEALIAGEPVPAAPSMRRRPHAEWRSTRYSAGLAHPSPKITDAPAPSKPRDPCLRCGTRADQHDEFGCAHWMPHG